ncbi:hypothetical protein [Streptomyces harbinensis]|uniref:Uncharacterized protein n=1 Tax=Streptomyces harbinensis TaxID=1176198 RepID=A0A1I6RP19_9ACTN|nr:hypothetical protein [Streptomyces harbinensis]SFS66432.1 hypothetical protein SAMN05444716_103241 [Streptomyces harbinensis]
MLSIAADGSYAARLVRAPGTAGDAWYAERWTLDGPEPYAVPLPAGQPEEPDSPVQPLADGRVLIARYADGRYHLALLYPSGPETGELPLGALESPVPLRLLPPAPDGARVYALVPDDAAGETAVWLVCGGAFGPELVTRVPGHCAGGAWLDAGGRLLALDRTDPATGHTRTVTVDVEAGGPPSELLRITEHSNDRLLMADTDSGLLLVVSDAPGEDRLGWGVLGSRLPVRFPEALHPDGVTIKPFAVQPGQMLTPEACAVALWLSAPEVGAGWVAVWRAQQREVQPIAAPEGWLAGVGRWTAGGELLLPYATEELPWGLARVAVPVPEPQPLRPAPEAALPVDGADAGGAGGGEGGPAGPVTGPGAMPPAAPSPAPSPPAVTKPVPLHHSPLARTD